MTNQPNIPYMCVSGIPPTFHSCYAVTLASDAATSLLGSLSITPKALMIKAEEANGGAVYLCDSDATTTANGFPIPDDSDNYVLIGVNHNNKPYAIADVATEKVRVIALV